MAASTNQGRGGQPRAAGSFYPQSQQQQQQQQQQQSQAGHSHSHSHHTHAHNAAGHDNESEEEEEEEYSDSSDEDDSSNRAKGGAGGKASSSSAGRTTSSNGNVSTRPPPKKRNRAALSCTLCRERKVKCDRVIPCYQCIKRGDAKFCQLDPTKRGPKQSRSQAARNQNAALQQQQQQQQQQQTVATHPSATANKSAADDRMPNPYYSLSSNSSAADEERRRSSNPTSYGGNGAPSPQDEVDAIKARLAQLEAVLAQSKQQQQQPSSGGSYELGRTNSSSSSSVPPFSEPSPNSSSSLGRVPWQQQPFTVNAENNRFVSSPSNRSGSTSSISTGPAMYNSGSSAYIHPYLQQQQQQQSAYQGSTPSDSSGAGPASGRLNSIPSAAASPVEAMSLSPYDSRNTSNRRSLAETRTKSTEDASAKQQRQQRSIRSNNNASQAALIPSTSKMEVDSDTEDAALVLEGLAMGGGSSSSNSECPTTSNSRRQQQGQNGNGASIAGQEGSNGTQINDGELEKASCPTTASKSGQNVIEKVPAKSFQGYVDADRTKDIMQSAEYDGTDEDEDDEEGGTCGSKATKKGEGKGEDAKMETDEDSAAVSTTKKDGDVCGGGDAEEEVDEEGKRVSPAKRVCRLLSKQDNSLFTLYQGPDTSFGFGIGWAFAAAEATGDVNAVSKVQGCRGARQREAVLRAIIRSLPEDEEVAKHLVDVYETRVRFLAGNCVHMPTFRREMQAFYHLDTVEKKARVVNLVDTGWLSLFCMILVLALHFHPCQRPDSVVHLFDGRTIHLWRSASQTCLVLARYQTSSSMVVLQAMVLITLYSCGTGFDNTSNLLPTAISNAIDMGLHRLGSRDKQPKAGESGEVATRREMAKRIWHQLTFYDACSSTTRGGANFIHPDQYNTPLPGNYNDEDLGQSPLPPPRPLQEHTDMSFALAHFDLGQAVRENVDRLNRALLLDGNTARLTPEDTSYLDARYRGLLENAPSFFRIGSEEGSGENVEVERWLLQQSVFHKLLKLHRPNLTSKPNARTSCVLLARSILDMQRRIRSRCSVVDRLFFNLSQSFSAAIVLCLDLLQTRPPATMRSIVRGEIFEALKALRHVGKSHHTTESSIRVIQALLDEEEARWNQMATEDEEMESSGPTSMKRKRHGQQNTNSKKNLLNLALRVAKAARCEGRSNSISAPTDEQATSNVDGSSSLPAVEAAAATQQPSAAAPDHNHNAVFDTLIDRRHQDYNALTSMLPPTNTISSLKDEESRRLFDQLLLPQPTGDDPSSFASLANNLQQQQPFGGFSQHVMAPNGLDLLGYQSTPPEAGGQDFDLSKFLAECDTKSSPDGSSDDQSMASGASHSGHSSLHGGNRSSGSSTSFSSSSQPHSTTHPSPNNSFSSALPPNTSNPSPAASTSSSSDISTSGLDGFWSWVLGQGGNGNPGSLPQQSSASNGQQQQVPTTSGISYNISPATSTAANINPALNAPPQKQTTPFSAATLPSPSSLWGGNSASQQPFAGAGASSPSPFPFAGFPTSIAQQQQQPLQQSQQQQQQQQQTTTSGTEAISMGTPSAGMGLGWMSTPGLFELAYEFGDGSAQSTTQAK